MAETIAIPKPSPSLFLDLPSSPASRPARQKPAPKASETSGVTKRKQSKSRNGCITCKAKRLKCDETKPSCQQCARRSVACGGYKKDFKWRSFEETNFTGKLTSKPKKDPSPPTSAPIQPQVKLESPRTDEFYIPAVPSAHPYNTPFAPPQSPVVMNMHGMQMTEPFAESGYHPSPDMYSVQSIPQISPFMTGPPPVSPRDQFVPGTVDSSTTLEVESIGTLPSKTTAPSSVSSGQSPRLLDLLLPGTDLSVPPEEYMTFRSQYPDSFYQPSGFTPPAETEMLDEDDVEDIPRSFDTDWGMMRSYSPPPSESSNSSTDSNRFPLLTQPSLSPGSSEMLTRRFDRDTCGILSVKDGPTENPWRTLVWPLARECPALFHAIASMTSFHQSRDSRMMRIHGIDHMHHSIHALASSLENMRVDAAISTTLVLAFSESWDQHIKTGMNHIKGAKCLIDRALVQHQRSPLQGEDLRRLKFLCNSWIYMDVIARLTSADADQSDDFDMVSDALYLDGDTDTHLDPLMGCASTLFPIIGRVANLVRKVRNSDSSSPSIISQAMELKKKLEEWVPPAFIEDPEDETTSPHDSLKTAAAYQYATLLYLHQAVPEIPSLPSALLAKRALCELASVHPSSRSVIVHIYPLMAAGCEAASEEDRQWVQSRWDMLSSRMKLGIIDKCEEVTKEVWRRRDEYADPDLMGIKVEGIKMETMSPTSPISPSLKRGFSSISDDMAEPDGLFCWLDVGTKRRAVSGTGLFDTPLPVPIKSERSEGVRKTEIVSEALPLEFTVKGRLHWLGVMKDWNWEVLLG